MDTGLSHSHSGLAYLVVLSSVISVLIAWASVAMGPKAGALKLAKILRIVQIALMGTTGLIGIGMWVKWKIPLTVWWAWVGLLSVVIHAVVNARGVKPNLTAVIDGDATKATPWAIAATVEAVVVIAIFVVMHFLRDLM